MLHSQSAKHPDGLAIDWIGRNIYWSDNLLNTIEVSRLDGRNRKVLKSGISEPRALQLYPAKGYLFYTDWGQEAHIGRMGMDGSNSTAIITESIGEIFTHKLISYLYRYFCEKKLQSLVCK